MTQFLTISGSLREASTNSAALDALALLAPQHIKINRYGGLANLPAYNPDLEEALPPEVVQLRKAINTADALIISSPEYARGMVGSFKNLLDWMVGDTDFAGKPVGIITTSTRAEHAPAQLRLVLDTMSAFVIDDACVTLDLLGQKLTAEEIANGEDLRVLLKQLIAGLLKSHE